VSVWEQNGSVGGVTLNLKAAPSPLGGRFTFGCGTHNGAASCNIGTVSYPISNARQLQAQISVPASDTSATSATLTATAASTSVKTNPAASVSVAVTAATSATTTPNVAAARNASLPLGDFPSGLNGTGTGTGSYLSSGGNASGLFPTIDPSSVPNPASANQAKRDPQAETAADASTLPLGMPVVDAQIAGLVALAIALGLAVTRLSVRRRPLPEQAPKN
jgi:hypothetical protein